MILARPLCFHLLDILAFSLELGLVRKSLSENPEVFKGYIVSLKSMAKSIPVESTFFMQAL